MSQTPEKKPFSLLALTVPDAAKLLSKAGGQSVEMDMLEADIAEGLPTNPDGSLNLVLYAAWLVKEKSRKHGD